MLLSIHLAMNYAAVRAVSMHSLNRQRANITLSTFLETGKILTPEEVSAQERIFERSGVLRWKGSVPIARAQIGQSLHDLARSLGRAHDVTGSVRDTESRLVNLVKIYRKEDFLLQYDSKSGSIFIILKEGASPPAQLKAWAMALWIAYRYCKAEEHHATSASSAEAILDLHKSTLTDLSNCWADCLERLAAAGWDLSIASLETASGSRVRLEAWTDE